MIEAGPFLTVHRSPGRPLRNEYRPAFLSRPPGPRDFPVFSRALASGLTLAAVVVAGCSESEPQTDVYPVNGTVTAEGKPLSRAVVTFHPVNPPKGARPDDPASALRIADADADGKYFLSTYTAADGAPVGEYVVTVVPSGGPSVEDGDAARSSRPARPAADLTRYAKKDTSPLKAAVKAGDNSGLNFDLR